MMQPPMGMGAGPGPLPPGAVPAGKRKPPPLGPLGAALGQMAPPAGMDYAGPPSAGGLDDMAGPMGGMLAGGLPPGAMPPGMDAGPQPGVGPADQSSALQQMLGGLDAAVPQTMPVQSSIQENREYLAAMLMECYPGMQGEQAHALLTQLEQSPASILAMPPDSPGRKVLDLIGDLGAQPPMQPSIMG